MELKNRESLTRADLKHNFLKTIIIRFDYSGISEPELEGVISKIKPVLFEKGYYRLSIELATEMDFQLDDPERVEMEGLPVQGVRRQKVYVFKNQNEGIQLKLSPVFAFILIEKTKYIRFTDYSGTLLDVVNIIKGEIPFFNPTRFGLRKINQCIINDAKLINTYFEPAYFRLFSINADDFSKISEAKDCIIHQNYNINFTRTIVHGELDGKDAFQLVLDSDIYLLETDGVHALLNDPQMLNPMNELLFDIYKMVLTEQFIGKLQMDCFTDKEIKGVERNDG